MGFLRRIIRIFLIIIVIAGVVVASELIISRYALSTTHYSINSERVAHSFRVVQLTDLHNSEFGKENRNLVSRVRKEKPDIILITGDLVNNKNGEDVSIASTLISNLSDIAPVYFSYGNQEKDLEKKNQIDIRQVFTEAGATVLEKEYTDISIKGQKIRLGGIYGYCLPDRYAQEIGSEEESAFLKEFQDTNLYTILMCHLPLCWLKYRSLYDWNADCIFAGHDHGGQVRIPFVGGLWAPDQGWFPGKECGIYHTEKEKWIEYMKAVTEWVKEGSFDVSYYQDYLLNSEYKDKALVLSRGLGNTDRIPRFNNVPEIVVVDFMAIKN